MTKEELAEWHKFKQENFPKPFGSLEPLKLLKKTKKKGEKT